VNSDSISGATGSLSLFAAPSGGTAPYSYSWSKTGSTKISLGATNGQSPGASWSGMNIGENASGLFAVTVTDAGGQTASGGGLFDLTRVS
jgi:hypothetical protein